MDNNSIFCSEYVNTDRQFEMDFAKAIGIICMVFCHVALSFLRPGSAMYNIFDNLGDELCTPVFMFCMGVSFCYTKNREPGKMAARGLRIFLMGYALNILRGVIPELLSSLLGTTPFTIGVLENLLTVDILQFAGLAMIVIALCIKIKLHPAIIFSISILFAAISDFLAGTGTGTLVFDMILGLFYPISELTCFPLLTWFIFPAAGLLFGTMLLRCTDKRKMYGALLPISGLITLFVHIVSMISTNYYTINLYYALGLGPAVLAVFVVFFVLSLGHFAQKKLSGLLTAIVLRMSSYLNDIYIISWLMINWLLLLTKSVLNVQLPVWSVFILMVFILVASYRLSVVYRKRKKAQR